MQRRALANKLFVGVNGWIGRVQQRPSDENKRKLLTLATQLREVRAGFSDLPVSYEKVNRRAFALCR